MQGSNTPRAEAEAPAWEIICAVAAEHGIEPEDIVGPYRNRRFSWPRQRAYALVRDLKRYSYPQIGRIFGGRDHTTIMYGIRVYEARVNEAWAAESAMVEATGRVAYGQ